MGKTRETIVHKTPEGEEILFPVVRIEGSEPGPHVVITGGLHGCEYPGIAAAIAISKELTPETVHGKVTVVTICSVQAFEARSMFVTPSDKKNPNRFFPGMKDGTYTDILVNHIYEDFIAGADYHLDIHGGDMVEALDPFCLYHTGAGAETDEKSRQLAMYYGLPGVIATQSQGTWPDQGTNYGNSAENGIPAIIAEVGNIGQLTEEDTALHLRGIKNVLKYVGVLDGEPVKFDNITEYRNFVWLYTPVKGIYYCNVHAGDVITEGQDLGRMEDYFGNHLADIKAPVSGKILFLTTSPAMKEKGLIMGIGALSFRIPEA